MFITTSAILMTRHQKIELERGFSLLEIVVTILLLGVMAITSVTVMNAFRMKAEQSMMVTNDLLNASTCMERIKALHTYDATKFKELLLKNEISAKCPGNPSVTASGVAISSKQDTSTKEFTETIKAQGACQATSALCLVTVKLNSAEFQHVFATQN